MFLRLLFLCFCVFVFLRSCVSVFLRFCVSVFLCVFVFAFLCFCVFVFLRFCGFVFLFFLGFAHSKSCTSGNNQGWSFLVLFSGFSTREISRGAFSKAFLELPRNFLEFL